MRPIELQTVLSSFCCRKVVCVVSESFCWENTNVRGPAAVGAGVLRVGEGWSTWVIYRSWATLLENVQMNEMLLRVPLCSVKELTRNQLLCVRFGGLEHSHKSRRAREHRQQLGNRKDNSKPKFLHLCSETWYQLRCCRHSSHEDSSTALRPFIYLVFMLHGSIELVRLDLGVLGW